MISNRCLGEVIVWILLSPNASLYFWASGRLSGSWLTAGTFRALVDGNCHHTLLWHVLLTQDPLFLELISETLPAYKTYRFSILYMDSWDVPAPPGVKFELDQSLLVVIASSNHRDPGSHSWRLLLELSPKRLGIRSKKEQLRPQRHWHTSHPDSTHSGGSKLDCTWLENWEWEEITNDLVPS